ncbi:MAG: hypothetical protein Q7U99_00585 [Rubrivivax sp.]|nr:hypothetical protein [Rubrivivax sp.]
MPQSATLGIKSVTAIGSITFDLGDGLDSGIALLLIKPPEQEITVKYRDCVLLASPDTPHVVCRFGGAHSHEDAYSQGSLLVQEALDVLSMTGRGDLVTREAEDEYFVWWATPTERSLVLVTTTTFSIKVGPVSITVKDAQGNVVPPTPVIPRHHIGFRFFRLSQASDDLYDAYRNMYLAFESLLSSRYPKTKGLEIDWLRQSLTAASTDLSLVGVVPAGTPDTISHVLSIIYEGARLPLFHAKDGKAYFAPVHNGSDREEVVKALTMLTHIVTRMADRWYSARRISGWVNLKIFEEQNQSLFSGTSFVFSDNPGFTLQDDLNSKSVKNGIRFPATFSETFGTDLRHNVKGELPVSSLADRGRLHALYLVNDESPLIGISPDTTVNLNGFDTFQVCVFVRGRNASSPKYIYPR